MDLMQFITQFDDTVRYPLIAESEDWKKISAALVEVGDITSVLGLTKNNALLWRMVSETIYTMGYRRGKESKSICFHVTGDQE